MKIKKPIKQIWSMFMLGLLLISCVPEVNGQVISDKANDLEIGKDIPSVTISSDEPDEQISVEWKMEQLNIDELFSGNLLLHDAVSGKDFVYKIKENELQRINTQNSESISFYNADISNDGKQLAGILHLTHQVFVYSKKGLQLYNMPDIPLSKVNFLDESHLFVRLERLDLVEKGKLIKEVGFTDEFFLINLESGVITKRSVFLPNFIVSREYYFPIQYSYDLKYVSYYSKGGHIQIMNISTNETYVINNDHYSKFNTDVAPVWIPNSNEITLLSLKDEDQKQENIYAVSVNGEKENLTNFTNAEISIPGLSFLVYPDWSPDGRFLVFNRKSDIDGHYYPYIYDSESGRAFELNVPEKQKLPFYSFTWTNQPSILLIGISQIAGVSGEEETTKYDYSHKIYVANTEKKIFYEIPIEMENNEELDSNQKYEFTIVGLVDPEFE